jgi:YegS/Rv2252/BmrU family lipid kinase
MRPFLVVNPRSGAGRTGRRFDRIARAVRAAVGEFDSAFTRARGDGARLAREAVAAGARFVVAVGGDGTASEVVDGLVGAGRDGAEAVFGFLPSGTGSDLRRTLGLPPDLDGAARVLSGGGVRACDVGRVEHAGPDGAPAVRHFVNVCDLGVGGVVVQKAERGPRLPSGKLAFMLASARALAGWSDVRVRWRADEGPWTEQAITALSVCNGRFFGGGMMVAPEARIDDGLFDVVVWSGLGFADFLTKKRRLYDGSHVSLPNTRVLRARTVEAEPAGDGPVLLDVDGEQPGRLPARVSILPGALRARVR